MDYEPLDPAVTYGCLCGRCESCRGCSPSQYTEALTTAREKAERILGDLGTARAKQAVVNAIMAAGHW